MNDASASAAEIDLGKLMLEFESIGDNCEFGLVQRQFGVEPQGLLRFNSAKLPNLLDALEQRFAGVDEVDVSERGGEAIVTVRRYGFIIHTWLRAAETDMARLHATMQVRNRYLRDRLIYQMQTGERILVRKSNAPPAPEDIEQLLAAIARYGRNVLLWVTEADAAHPAGSVAVAGEGLLRGYLDRCAPYSDPRAPSLDSWAQICREAWRLTGGHERTRHLRPLTSRPVAWRFDFTARPSVAAQTGLPSFRAAFAYARPSVASYLDAAGRLQLAEADTPRFDCAPDGSPLGVLLEPAAENLLRHTDSFAAPFASSNAVPAAPSDAVPALRHRAVVLAHRLPAASPEQPAYHQFIPSGPQAGEVYTFSCYVWIPGDFAGTGVSAAMNGFPRSGGRGADLRHRDQWQRIWGVARCPDGLPVADPTLRFGGPAGTMIYSTCWQFEAGEAPTSYIPAGDSPGRRAAGALRCSGAALAWFRAQGSVLEWEGDTPGNAPVLRLWDGADAERAVLLRPARRVPGAPRTAAAAFEPDGVRCTDGSLLPRPDPAALTCLDLLAAGPVHHRVLRFRPAD